MAVPGAWTPSPREQREDRGRKGRMEEKDNEMPDFSAYLVGFFPTPGSRGA